RAWLEAPTVAGLAGLLGGGEEDARQKHARPKVVPAERPELIPVSYAQRRLWFIHDLEGPSATYHIPIPLRLTGALDLDAVRAAMRDMMGRHESLRTVFVEVEGEPYQRILGLDEIRPEPEIRDCDAAGL